jgi:(p)ppGpp synthase/HD superfamily hydrolase
MVGGARSAASWERLPHAHSAAAFAERKHAGQRRSDGTPFIQHPREVASLLYEAGASDDVIAAGLLHDVIEKAGVAASELGATFGPQITSVVVAVSDDDRIESYAARKAALRRQVAGAGEDALTVFAADKLSKLRELEREIAVDSPVRNRRTRARRLRHYQRSLALLEERLPESPLVRELRDELGSFAGERTTPAAGHANTHASH